MKKVQVVVLFLLLFAYSILLLDGGAAYANAKDENDIVVGIDLNRKPLSYQEDGHVKGVLVDLINLLADKNGWKVTYRALSVGETGKHFIDSNKGQLVAGVMESDFSKINPALLQSETLLKSDAVFVGRKDLKVDTNKPLIIALTPQFINGKCVVHRLFPNFDFYDAKTDQECLRAIKNGDADAMIQNYFIAMTLLRDPEYENLNVYPAYLFEEHVKIVGIDSNLMAQVNQGIEKLTEDEKLKIVLENTMNQKLTMKDVWYRYQGMIVVCFVIFAIVLFAVIYIIIIKRKNIQKLEKMNQELKELAEKEKEANAAKTKFLSQMSHDLRTPMNGILGVVELIQNQKDLNEIQSGLEEIEISGQYLLNLINDTLDMNRIESGKMKLHYKPVKIQKLYQNVLHLAKQLVAEKGLKLKVSFPSMEEKKDVTVMADISRVEQIFINIITNAVHFSSGGGSIEMSAEVLELTDDKMTERYVICDEGCGISKEFLPHIFEPFSQEEREDARNENGAGLGLSIVKQLVEMMSGTIEVTSEVDQGTTVSVVIPYQICDEVEMNLPKEDNINLKGKHVLACEDHPLNMKITKKLLEREGVDVDLAENGVEGVNKFMNSALFYYDAILMDIQMPLLDGIQATKQIRRLIRDDAKNVPIIAMSANSYDHDVRLCMDAGMNAHLSKPVGSRQLYQTLFRYIKNRKGAYHSK